MLYKLLNKPDRQQTQLAYRIKYWPHAMLSPAAKELISFHKNIYMRKQDIDYALDETMEHLTINHRNYKIVWAYNNVPTEQEWQAKSPSYLVKTELRFSPAIPELAVVILSFELPINLELQA
jgi:hypothetical protein